MVSLRLDDVEALLNEVRASRMLPLSGEVPGVLVEVAAYLLDRADQYATESSCIARGEGDVDSLCAWRVAELRRQGLAAEVVLVMNRSADGGVPFTCRVRLPDGTYEDVSSLCGRSVSWSRTDQEPPA